MGLDYVVIQNPVELPIESTNCIIIFNDPLTIIDPGVKSAVVIDNIEKALKRKGKELSDIKRLLLTHGHVDHFGGSYLLRDFADFDIYIHKSDEDKTGFTADDDKFKLYKDVLINFGCPDIGIEGLYYFFKHIASFYDPLPKALNYSDTVDFKDMSLHVVETPGHTSGSVIFYSPQQRLIFGGDTVLKNISPNPVLEFTHTGERFASVLSYRKSIEKVLSLNAKLIIPGHGENVTNIEELVCTYRKGWRELETSVLTTVKELGKADAYEVAMSVFGELRGFEIFLGMSEIIGYFDYLKGIGKIKIAEDKGILKAELS
jgi:glyoxylase-like metal-dependent hydrolase (beta-lactamase superfamily II)